MASAAASCAFPGYRRMADIGFFGRHVRRECGSEHPHGCQAGWCSGGSAVDRQSWPAMRSRAAPVPAALPSASGVIHIAIFRYATSISYLFARDRHLRLLIGWAYYIYGVEHGFRARIVEIVVLLMIQSSSSGSSFAGLHSYGVEHGYRARIALGGAFVDEPVLHIPGRVRVEVILAPTSLRQRVTRKV